MSDAHPHDQEAPDVALARQVDAICRRFEADWRAGRRPAIGDYLGEIAEEGRRDPARRARGPRERACARRTRRQTVCTGEFAHVPDPGHGEPPGPRGSHRGAPRSGHGRSRIIPGRSSPRHPHRPASATSAITSCSARSPAAAWGWSTGPGRSA